jgi:F-type H+-transporting ATPase subunit b
MLIDWFTVVAQIVNFLVLVALLRRFLFGRLVAAMDAREKRIAARLADADKKNHDADERAAQLKLEAEQQEQQRARILAEARESAEHQRQEMIEKARETVRALETKWRGDLAREEAAFLDEIRARAADEILAVVRRALHDLASEDLQHSAVGAFLKKMEATEPGKFDHDLVLRSAFDFDPETRQRIEAALGRVSRNGARVRFETAPELGWGLELRTDGHRIGWNPASYVDTLEENVRKALEARNERFSQEPCG